MEKFLESPEIILQNDDILLTKDGTIGKVAYIKDIPDGKASLNAHIHLIRNLENNAKLPPIIANASKSGLSNILFNNKYSESNPHNIDVNTLSKIT